MDLGSLTGQLPNQLSKYLNGLHFPADKDNVVKHAESNQADSKILGALKKLPPGVYKNINEVAQKIGASNLLG
jgi:O6-methylguanine-DNA--protein-cysteine methyltransferase